MSEPDLRIAAFPKGSDVWRVDWFGSVAFPDRMSQRRHPSVLVYLSKVVAPSPLENQATLLNPESTRHANLQVKKWVSVGTMMLLRVGDLWQNQTLLARPAYEEEIFEEITINPNETSLVKAGVSFEDGSFLLPLSHHPWHINNTHSYCVRVALPDDKFIVAPCMELVRFYFGSSSELLSRLFTPPLAKASLYGRASLSSRGRMNLELGERIPKASAEDIARIAGSDAAWRAAARIPTSCLNASRAGREIYPQAIFPFEGPTTLKAVGKWLPRGTEAQGVFLVYHLLGCSHPFPFRSLHFTQPVSSLQRPSNKPIPTSGEENPRPLRSISEPKSPVLLEYDASSILAPTKRAVHSHRRFSDLDNKFIQAIPSHRAAPSPTVPAGSAPAIAELAVGSPGSSRRIRPVSLVDAMAEARAEMPAFLSCVASALEAIESIKVHALKSSEGLGWTLPTNLLTDDDGVIPDKLLFHRKKAKLKRVGAFLLSKDDKHAVVTAVEGQSLLLYFSTLAAHQSVDPATHALSHARYFGNQYRGGTDMLGISETAHNSTETILRWLVPRLAKRLGIKG